MSLYRQILLRSNRPGKWQDKGYDTKSLSKTLYGLEIFWDETWVSSSKISMATAWPSVVHNSAYFLWRDDKEFRLNEDASSTKVVLN